MLPGSILNGCTTQGSSPSGCHTRWNPKLIQMGNIKFIDFTSCNLYQIFDFICRTMHLLMYIHIYICTHTHIYICVPWKAYLLWIETGSQKIVKHFCSIFVSSTFKASFLWWNSLGPMRWIGTIIPPAWNHDDFTILAAMSKRRTRSAWPHVSPKLDLLVFLMFYRASMEETQFKSVMSSPDQAEWICPNCPFPDCWTIPIYQVISIHWSSPIITGTIDRRLRSALRKMRIAKNFQVLIAKGGCLSVKIWQLKWTVLCDDHKLFRTKWQGN